jgi:uncharacterized protein YneF (UPF0154 family)
MKEIRKRIHENGHHDLEDQVRETMQTVREENPQLWIYLVGAILALLAGFLAAYLYTKARKKPKSRWEKIKDALFGGIL